MKTITELKKQSTYGGWYWIWFLDDTLTHQPPTVEMCQIWRGRLYLMSRSKDYHNLSLDDEALKLKDMLRIRFIPIPEPEKQDYIDHLIKLLNEHKND